MNEALMPPAELPAASVVHGGVRDFLVIDGMADEGLSCVIR
jgi:hypothetical protein